MSNEFDSMDIELIEEAYNHLPTNPSAAASDLAEIVERYGSRDIRPAGYSRVADALDALKEDEPEEAEEFLNAVIRGVEA